MKRKGYMHSVPGSTEHGGVEGGDSDVSSRCLVVPPPAQQSQERCHPPRLVQRGHGIGHGTPEAPWQGEHGLVKELGFATP